MTQQVVVASRTCSLHSELRRMRAAGLFDLSAFPCSPSFGPLAPTNGRPAGLHRTETSHQDNTSLEKPTVVRGHGRTGNICMLGVQTLCI